MNLPNIFNNIPRLLKDLKTKPEEYWLKRGERRALKLFHQMAVRVPAYKDFLKKHRLNHNTIKTIKDFKKVPLISKDNYLRKYPLEKLCWDGEFSSRQWDISSTSGSTGEPFYFPRSDVQNWQYALTAELYLLNNFNIDKKRTLYINCFALGVWIGGLFTYEAIKMVERNGNYPLTIISPGLNKMEILKAVKNLAKYFDQVIIGGYPPFVKDIIDEGIIAGINWKKYNLKFIFSAEAFSEEFRDYIVRKVGLKNIYSDTLNHYGTVDQGTIAHETPLAVLIRRLAIRRPKLFSLVFREGLHRLPTLAQYHPELFWFEEINEGVVCTADSGMPLVRYDLKDNGGVFSFNAINRKFGAVGFNLIKIAKNKKINSSILKLPFVYVYERKDMSVSFSGANIYPAPIKKVFHHQPFDHYFTGKFNLLIKSDKQQDPYLIINIELKKGIRKISKKIKKALTESILDRLLKDNSEYRSVYHDQKQERAIPRLVFWLYEHSSYFRPQGKQRWVLKD